MAISAMYGNPPISLKKRSVSGWYESESQTTCKTNKVACIQINYIVSI